MKIKALVAVRSGSVRVPSKNTRAFAGETLIDIKLKQLLRIKDLDGIIVNSNSQEMLGIAEKYKVSTVHRDEYFASNYVSMSEVYKNMAENFDGDIVVYCNVTNPLIDDTSISNAIHAFLGARTEYDSLNTTHLIKEFMFLDGKPINYDLKKQPRSQDLPDIHALNFAISIISRENMIKYMNVVGMKPFLFPLNEIEAVDVDSLLDFEIAEMLYRKRSVQD